MSAVSTGTEFRSSRPRNHAPEEIMRRPSVFIVVSGVALALGACAAAPAPEAGVQEVASDERVCKRITPTGSNMPQRVCQTAEQWAAAERAGRQGVEEMKRQNDALGTGGQLP
jgi:hypothetical protein